MRIRKTRQGAAIVFQSGTGLQMRSIPADNGRPRPFPLLVRFLQEVADLRKQFFTNPPPKKFAGTNRNQRSIRPKE